MHEPAAQSWGQPRAGALVGPGPGGAAEPMPHGLATSVAQLAGAAEVADAELVRAVLSGSDDAFSALVVRYQKRAFWVAFHVVGRVEDARDIVQEAFVRLFRSLRRYDHKRSFYTWFYRIIMNLAIDHLRKHKNDKSRSVDDLLGGLPDETDDVDVVERQEQVDQVWAVLARLDVKFRSVMVLRDIHGMSCREIAPILRITHATVRWRLHRGRQLFKEQWERMVGGES